MVRRSIQIGWVVWLVCGLAQASWANGARLPSFTVRDSIQMTRIVDPKQVPKAFGNLAPSLPKWSPDRRHFFIVTMKGDVGRDLNLYTLLLFDASAVGKAMASEDMPDAARGVPVVRFATSSTRAGIDDARWLPGSQQLAFIGRAEDGAGQVYSYDLKTRAVSKWTTSPHDVVKFDLSIAGDSLVYATEEPWVTPEADRKGYEVTAENAIYLQGSIRRTATRYYTKRLTESVARQLSLAPALTVFGPRQIYLSPDGRWAVTSLTLRRYPASWIGYRFVQTLLDEGLLSRSASNDELVFSSYLGPDDSIGQFYLFDLRSLDARPLLDAPTFIPGVEAVFYEGAEAKWSDDGRRVLLSSTMLPLETEDRAERSRRESAVFVAEVDPETTHASAVTQIHTIPSAIDFAYAVPSAWVNWLGTDRVSVSLPSGSGPARKETDYVRLRSGGGWREGGEHNARARASRDEKLSVRIAQDMSSPPEVEAVGADGQSRRLTDLNPQFRALDMAGVRTFEWTDRHGRAMSAGLVTPPRFDEKRRYPVVIQLGRFHPGDFVVDGMGMFGTTAFASRALAGRDILVVEPSSLRPMPAIPGEYEGQMITELVEDLIDALERAGRIDPMKVGIIGFSRTGMYAQHVAAFSTRPLAAITVADSVATTPFCYAREYGSPAPSMTQFEDAWQLGAPFWGKGVSQWVERSDLFHLDRISAAVRYETNGEKVPCYWEAFAILSRMGHPVEMIHLPRADHLLVTPGMRLTSQEGNVDWFSFWLTGYVDSAVEKRDQYARWQALRERKSTQPVHVVRDAR